MKALVANGGCLGPWQWGSNCLPLPLIITCYKSRTLYPHAKHHLVMERSQIERLLRPGKSAGMRWHRGLCGGDTSPRSIQSHRIAICRLWHRGFLGTGCSSRSKVTIDRFSVVDSVPSPGPRIAPRLSRDHLLPYLVFFLSRGSYDGVVQSLDHAIDGRLSPGWCSKDFSRRVTSRARRNRWGGWRGKKKKNEEECLHAVT